MIFSLDIETTGLDRFNDKILVIGVYSPSTGYRSFKNAMEFGHWNNSNNEYIMHNGSFDVNFLRHNGVNITNQLAYDTRSIASLLPTQPRIAEGQKNAYGLENLNVVLLSGSTYKLDRDRMSSYSFKELENYNKEDCVITYKLFEYLTDKLNDKTWEFAESWIGPATRLCAELEYNGIYGDWAGLNNYKNDIEVIKLERLNKLLSLTEEPRKHWKEKQLKELRDVYENKKTLALSKAKDPIKRAAFYEALYAKACSKIEDFNWNSPQQLIWLLGAYYNQDLFNTRTEKITTDDEKLKSLEHPVAKALVDYREVEKLLTQQIPALLDNVKADQCVHGRFSVGGTRTGRLSSSQPNLQQISARKPLGKKIRSFIQARPGYTLVTIDYAQIEPRLIAHAAKEPKLLDAFKSGADVYSVFANEIFDLKETDFSKHYFAEKYPTERACGKTAGLSVLYGTGPKKFAEMVRKETGTELSLQRSKQLVDTFRNNLAAVGEFKAFLEKKLANQNQYLNLLGRPITIEHNDDLYMLGLNTFIQSSASDLVVDSQANVVIPQLKYHGIDFTHRLLVHDETVLELRQDEADQLVKEIIVPMMTEGMQRRWSLDVPIKVDYIISKRWEKG